MAVVERVVEITITLRRLALLTVTLAALAVVLAYYPRLKLMAMKALSIPLADVELDKGPHRPGERITAKICLVPEIRGEKITVLVEDPEGRAVYTLPLRTEGRCIRLIFTLRRDMPEGVYRLVVVSQDSELAAKSFEFVKG